MAVLSGARLSGKAATTPAKRARTTQSPRGFSVLAGLYLLCAPNQNRHATQATLFKKPKDQKSYYVVKTLFRSFKHCRKTAFSLHIYIYKYWPTGTETLYFHQISVGHRKEP